MRKIFLRFLSERFARFGRLQVKYILEEIPHIGFNQHIVKTALIAVMTLSSGWSFGQLVEEPFNYPNGDLAGKGSWVAHLSSGLSSVQVLGGRIVVEHGSGGREDVNIPFTEQTSGTVYASFDFSVFDLGSPVSGTDSEYFVHFNTGSTVMRARMDVVPPTGAGDYSVGISSTTSTAENVWATDLSFGTFYTAVIAYSIDDGQATLWIDPTKETSTNVKGNTSSGYRVSAFVFRQSNSSSNERILIDNLTIGTAFTEVVTVVAETITWDGSASSDWNTPENWLSDEVPAVTDNVVIANAGSAPVIGAGTVVGCNNLTIDASATLTVSSGGSLAIFGSATNNGTYTVEKMLEGSGGISFLGSPVSDAVISDLSDADFVYDYSNASGWQETSGAATMSAGVGYSVGYNETNPTVSFTGTPNDGDVTLPITSTSGFELVANPYAAAIDVENFLIDNSLISGGVYLWDDGGANVGDNRGGDYISLTAMGAATSVEPGGTSDEVSGATGTTPASDGYIASLQGFFVEVSGSGSLTFSADQQVLADGSNDESDHYRAVGYQKVKLAIKGNGLYDEVLIGLGEDATYGVDRILEAKKFNTNNPLSFYSLMGEDKYVIQALPNLIQDEMVVPLGFDLTQSGDFELNLVNMQNLNKHVDVSVRDNQTGKVYDLRETESIAFHTKTSTDNRRFELVFSMSSVLSFLEAEQGSLKVYGSQSEVSVFKDAEGGKKVAIYSMGGVLIMKQELDFVNNQARANVSLNRNQMYVLRVDNEAVKFIIK
ncbi:MAG: hypothetical protein ABJN36_13135 [Cyclobacteriaceae bacterium]